MGKMVEVDEEQLLRDQRLRALVEKIYAHPEAGVLVEQAAKLVDPNAKTPKLDAKKAVTEPMSAVEKKLEEFIAAQTKAQQERDAENKRNELKTRVDTGIANLRRQGWTDEGIKAVEKLMEDKGILDPLDAAAIYEKHNPPPAPTTPSGGAWNFPEIPKDGGDLFEKALLDSKGQNDLIAEREAMNVLNEIRGSRRN